MGEPSRILLIQLKRAGDVVVTTPVISALKKKFPATEIDFLVEKPFIPLLEHNPHLHRSRTYDKTDILSTWRRIRETHYDWIFDFQSSPRSALVCLASGAALTAGYQVPFWGLAYKTTVKRPGANLSVVEGKFTLIEKVTGPLDHETERHLFLTLEEKNWAEAALVSPQAPVGIIPTHRHPIRRWHAASFIDLARRLQKKTPVWWFWGPGEESYVQAIAKEVPGSVMVPATSLRHMAALLARCRCVITNDNGPMHIATAVGTPTITIYGPTDPLCWNPGGPRHRAIAAEGLRCLKCNLSECPFEHECMTLVTPEQVEWLVDDVERGNPR